MAGAVALHPANLDPASHHANNPLERKSASARHLQISLPNFWPL